MPVERERLVQLFEQAPAPIAILTGPHHTYTFLNAPFKNLFFPDQNPIGRTVKDSIPAAVEQGFGELLDHVYKTGQKHTGTETPFLLRLSDGTEKQLYLDFTYDALRCPEGKIEGILCFAVDVTDKVLARKKAEQGEEFMHRLLDSIPQITYYGDKEGRIIAYNKRWYEYIGTSNSQMEGDNGQNSHVIHPEDNEITNTLWFKSIRTGEAYEVNHRIRRHDGVYRWHICRAVPVKDEKGEIVSWFGTSTDIHEQYMMAENTEIWLKQILNLLPKPLFMIDIDNQKVSYSNKAANEMLTRDLSGSATQTDRSDHVAVSDLNGNTLPNSQYPSSRILAGEVLVGEEFIMKVNTRSYHLEAYSAELPVVPGQARSALLLLNDISALKASEGKLSAARDSAEKANRAKSQFLANMSHEIRSPLGAIMGFSDLMRSPDLSRNDIAEYVNVIERNSAHLLRIIDDILDLSKVEAGMVVIEKIPFSLSELLKDVVSLMEFKSTEKGINFKIRFESAVPETIVSDPTRIRQILSNIVGNAIKFTAKGRVNLAVSFADDKMTFRVVDTGIGISPEQTKLLFNPFQQADDSTTRNFGGTGLGLVLTRRLTQTMGGTFELLKSEVGVGTTFVASIQVSIPESTPFINKLETSSSPDKSLPPDANSLQDTRILLVEDSRDNRVLIKLFLTSAGAEVDFANDGIEGVEMALSHEYDVILCDMQMPRRDGYGTIRELQAHQHKAPVIALTAHAMKEEYDRAMRAGFADYLTKPVQKQDLINTIAKHRNRASANRPLNLDLH